LVFKVRGVNEALVELFKHKTWATLLVIEALQGVDADVLDLTTSGTYGTIRDTSVIGRTASSFRAWTSARTWTCGITASPPG
jgi:hypothetical protein